MGGGSKIWKEKKGSQKEVEKVEGRGAKKKERYKKKKDIRENSWEGGRGKKIKIKKKKKETAERKLERRERNEQ